MIKLTSNTFDRAIFYLASLYICFIYFSVAISNIFLGLTIAAFVIGIATKKLHFNLDKRQAILYFVIIIPFVLTLISLVNSYNTSRALGYIWMRLPIVILPLILLNVKFLNKKDITHFAYLYIASSLLATFITFYNLIYHYFTEGKLLKPNFNEDVLTPIQHPYFGIFIVIAITVVFFFKLFKKYPFVKYGLFSLFSLAVLFSTSRMALLLLIIFWGYVLVIYAKKIKYRILIISALSFIGFLAIANTVYKEKITNTFSYWDSPRVYLWDNAYKVLKYSQNKFSGVGIGDYYRLKRNPQDYISSQRGTYGFNPHNQYLEFVITNGVFGLLFLFTILYLLFISYKNKNSFAFIIVVIISSFSFTECIFNRQFGVQLYAFFIPMAILMITFKNQNKINV